MYDHKTSPQEPALCDVAPADAVWRTPVRRTRPRRSCIQGTCLKKLSGQTSSDHRELLAVPASQEQTGRPQRNTHIVLTNQLHQDVSQQRFPVFSKETLLQAVSEENVALQQLLHKPHEQRAATQKSIIHHSDRYTDTTPELIWPAVQRETRFVS